MSVQYVLVLALRCIVLCCVVLCVCTRKGSYINDIVFIPTIALARSHVSCVIIGPCKCSVCFTYTCTLITQAGVSL